VPRQHPVAPSRFTDQGRGRLFATKGTGTRILTRRACAGPGERRNADSRPSATSK